MFGVVAAVGVSMPTGLTSSSVSGTADARTSLAQAILRSSQRVEGHYRGGKPRGHSGRSLASVADHDTEQVRLMMDFIGLMGWSHAEMGLMACRSYEGAVCWLLRVTAYALP